MSMRYLSPAISALSAGEAYLVARLNLSLPNRNQGRLEKNGFAVAGIALLALLSVSVLGLTTPAQVSSFIFAVAFVLVMVLASRILARYKIAVKAAGLNPPGVLTGLTEKSWWNKVFGDKLKQK